MAEDPTTRLRPFSSPAPHPTKPRRRRGCLACSICCCATLIVVAVVILVLALVVFKQRDPTITLQSVKVEGVSPSVSFPAISIQLNLTLVTVVAVYNPNRASFAHDPGDVEILYRDTQVGHADVSAGTIPAQGKEEINSNVTLTLQSFTGNLQSQLIQDVLGGKLELETKARVPGKVKVLGFIKKRIVAISECRLTIGIPSMTLDEQKCKQKAKL